MKNPLTLTAIAAALCLAGVAANAHGALQSAANSSSAPAASASSATPADATSTRIDAIMKRLGSLPVHYRSVAVSPDGQSLAWVTSGKDAEKSGSRLQIASFDGSQAKTVTIKNAAKGCGVGGLDWAPDGGSLAFLSNCNHGKEKDQQDIYRVKSGSTSAQRISHLDGAVNELAWTPDGRSLSFLYVKGDLHGIGASSATKPRVGVIGEEGIERQAVATVSVADGKLHQVTPDSVFVYEYSWAPNSKELAYVGAPPPGRDNWWVAKLYTQTLDGSPTVLVDPGQAQGSLHKLQIAHPVWSPDGSTLAFIGGLMSDQGVTGGDIYTVPRVGGQATDVTPGIDITPSWMTFTDKSSLLVSSFAGGDARLSAFTLNGQQAASHTKLLSVPADISDGSAMSAVSLSKSSGRIAFIHSSFEKAPEIYTAQLQKADDGALGAASQSPQPVTHGNDGVKPMWGRSESITWKNDGYNVQGWLLFPADYDPARRYPMIVYVHGGPTYANRPRWPGAGYGPAPLSAMGYFVLMPNPRGSFGQGEKFTQAVRKDMGYGDLRDILKGVDAVEAKYPVDNKRLGITGWSYGGFMSMFAPTQTNRFAAAVVGAGLSNWQSYYGENSIDQWMIPFFGASVYDDPKVYAKSSAINFIKDNKTPSLVVVGQYDGETPAPQSFEFWHALRAQNVPTKLVVYPGEGHGFTKPEHRRDVLKRSLAWFDKYLGQHAGAKAESSH